VALGQNRTNTCFALANLAKLETQTCFASVPKQSEEALRGKSMGQAV
jgi:hypothetical protein